MNLTRIYAIFLRQVFLMRRNPARLAGFLWVVLDIFLWGFITKFLNTLGVSGLDFIALFLGGIILWNFMIRVQQGIMTAFFEDVWSRNFLNIFASPIAIGEYLAGLVVAGVVMVLVSLILMLSIAVGFFGFSLFRIGMPLIPFFLVLFLFGMTLGIFVIALILRWGPSAEWIGWPLPFLLYPFSGVFYPVSVLPLPARLISRLLPTSYVFEGMREVLASGVFSFSALAPGLALACLFLGLAYIFFNRTYRMIVRTGMLARFGAEG
ncbi:MAG: ABC transporter permease [bacterium]|nr:ABC transporter permease [bacterium]